MEKIEILQSLGTLTTDSYQRHTRIKSSGCNLRKLVPKKGLTSAPRDSNFRAQTSVWSPRRVVSGNYNNKDSLPFCPGDQFHYRAICGQATAPNKTEYNAEKKRAKKKSWDRFGPVQIPLISCVYKPSNVCLILDRLGFLEISCPDKFRQPQTGCV